VDVLLKPATITIKIKYTQGGPEMPEFKMITHEHVPLRYELLWSAPDKTLVLRIHKDIISLFPAISNETPIVKHFMTEFGFQSFVGTLTGNFGFDDVFKLNRKNDSTEFVELLVKLPKIRVLEKEPCTHCNGTGKRVQHSKRGKCLRCHGKGRCYTYNWKKAYAISASFGLFFRMIEFPKKETSSLLPQLLLIRTTTAKGIHGGSLGGNMSIPLCNWMRTFPFDERFDLPEVEQATRASYETMMGRTEYERFGAYTHCGKLVADCPGDACGIHPNDWHEDLLSGHAFACHNVDSPAQQISLLVALAALCDKARKEILS